MVLDASAPGLMITWMMVEECATEAIISLLATGFYYPSHRLIIEPVGLIPSHEVG